MDIGSDIMSKSKLNIRLLAVAAVILVVGITAFFLITKDNNDKKPVKGVFVINMIAETK